MNKWVQIIKWVIRSLKDIIIIIIIIFILSLSGYKIQNCNTDYTKVTWLWDQIVFP